MNTINNSTVTATVNLEELVAAIRAVRTEGRLCQKNWESEVAKESPSEKRLSFLSNQGVRLHKVLSLLNGLLPPDYTVDEQPKTLPSPMDFAF